MLNEGTLHSVSGRVRAFESRLGVAILGGEHAQGVFAWPNVRAKRATTAGRQARAGENVPRTTGPGLVACRWRSA